MRSGGSSLTRSTSMAWARAAASSRPYSSDTNFASEYVVSSSAALFHRSGNSGCRPMGRFSASLSRHLEQFGPLVVLRDERLERLGQSRGGALVARDRLRDEFGDGVIRQSLRAPRLADRCPAGSRRAVRNAGRDQRDDEVGRQTRDERRRSDAGSDRAVRDACVPRSRPAPEAPAAPLSFLPRSPVSDA